MTRGIIFDYGGTLDTQGNHWGKVLWHAYERSGIGIAEDLFREAYVHAERMLAREPVIGADFTFRDTLMAKIRIELQHLQSAGHWAPTAEEHDTTLGRILHDAYSTARQCTQEAAQVLGRLHGRYPMVLVSNFYGNIGNVLREFGLDGLFQSVIESAVVGIRKPDPRIFALGIEALGMEPQEVTVVGDSMKKDIIPAKSLGCHTIWIKGEGWTDDEEDPSAADKTITRLQDIGL